MLRKQRIYDLGIWSLGLGYFLFYTPYSALTKALSNGLLPGMRGPVSGTILLPASVMAVTAGMLCFITMMNWWEYAGRREFFGISIPFPGRLTFLSGICMATIMGTTTLVFCLEGVSIVLVLVLLRGGVLIIAPLVDRIVGRRVRWFSWTAMSISLTAVLLVLADAANYKLTLAAIITVAAYITAYFVKFQLMSTLAKTDDKNTTLRYFVEEQMVASPLLLLTLVVLALIGPGEAMAGFRLGLTTFLYSREAIFALLIGIFYAGLCICTTLIFLDRRENTFCVPMHCGSSMMAGLTATFVLGFLFHSPSASSSQMMSAGLIVMALGFLSPLHHFQRVVRNVKARLSSATRILPGLETSLNKSDALMLTGLQPVPLQKGARPGSESEAPDHLGQLRRGFLFVCSGNTCRSPIAEAIGNAEIAARLQIPFSALESAKLRAVSAGISVSIGAPMTADAQQALRFLNVPVVSHGARSLTVEMAHQVEKIFCMTEAHRNAVINLVPAAAGKTHCLDLNGDVDDPSGKGLGAHVNCAQRIHGLVRQRFDEMGLRAE